MTGPRRVAQPVFEIPDREWLRFFEVNVLSGVRLARHYAPRMAARGWERMTFLSSEAASCRRSSPNGNR